MKKLLVPSFAAGASSTIRRPSLRELTYGALRPASTLAGQAPQNSRCQDSLNQLVMSEGKYDPSAFSEGIGIFEEHLRQTCPEALEMLKAPTIGFHYTAGGFIYSFRSEHRESFERLSKPPLVRFVAEAARAAGFNLSLESQGGDKTIVQLSR
jgi:hypothetical protein